MSKSQFSKLVESFEKFSYVELIAINLDNTVIAGHMRLKALKKQGWKNIEVRVPDRLLDDQECREYLIRSNKNVGDWDYDILGNEFHLKDLCDWGFDEKDFGIDLSSNQESEGSKDKEEKEACPYCGKKGKARK